jgi:2-phospho-L-lactate guanylyltransferase
VLVVIPFRAGGKSRLPSEIRAEVALAMLGDVVEAAVEVGEARVVTDDPAGGLVAGELGAEVVGDPGGGQGAAVASALAAVEGVCLVVNADVPRVRPSDLGALAVPARLGGLALVEAADGTTNALGLPLAEAFRPLFGPGSGRRYREHADALGLTCAGLALPNLVEDVDTLADLERVGPHGGPRTRAMLQAIAR